MKQNQELLTHEIFIKNNILYIHIPVSGLINPQYLLKNDKLYIFLYNYTQAYVISDLSQETIEYIIKGRAYIRESLSYDNSQDHYINFIPS